MQQHFIHPPGNSEFKFKSSIQSLSEGLASWWSRREALNLQMCRWGVRKQQSGDTLKDNLTASTKAGWKRAYFATDKYKNSICDYFAKALKWQRM